MADSEGVRCAPGRRAVASLLAVAFFAAISACRTNQPAHDYAIPVSGGFVEVHVPGDHTRVGVIALHSLDHSWTEPVAQGWSTVSDEYGFVAIYPDRPGASWNAGLCCGSASATNRDDVSWLVGVIAQMRARYGLTTIYLTGFSNGGMMVERLVAEHPEITTRFAVWGAAPEMPSPGHWSGNGYIYDGALDLTVPWLGGLVNILGTTYAIRPAQSTASWLIGAHLSGHLVPGYAHPPEPGWSNLAWSLMSS